MVIGRTDLSREGFRGGWSWAETQTKASTHAACGSAQPGMRIEV